MSTHSGILRNAGYRSDLGHKSDRWAPGPSLLLVVTLSLALWAGIIWAATAIL